MDVSNQAYYIMPNTHNPKCAANMQCLSHYMLLRKCKGSSLDDKKHIIYLVSSIHLKTACIYNDLL